MRHSIINSGLMLTAGNALSIVLSFVRNILIARIVGVENYGVVAILGLVLSIVELSSNFSVDKMIVQTRDGDDIRLESVGHFFQVIRGLIASLILLVLSEYLTRYFHIESALYALIMISSIPALKGLVSLEPVRLQRKFNFRPSVVMEVVSQLVGLVTVLVLSNIIFSYWLYVWTSIIMTVTNICISHRFSERKYSFVYDKHILARYYSYGWPLLINAGLMFVIFEGDKLIVASNFDLKTVGWFGAATTLTLAPYMLVTKVSQSLLLPVLSKSDNNQIQGNYYFAAIKLNLYLGIFVAYLFILCGAEIFISCFGNAYILGMEYIGILGLIQGVRIVKSTSMTISLALAKTKVPMISNTARIVAFFCSVYLALIYKNIWYVVVVSLIGELIALILSIYMLELSTFYKRALVDYKLILLITYYMVSTYLMGLIHTYVIDVVFILLSILISMLGIYYIWRSDSQLDDLMKLRNKHKEVL